MYDCEVCKMHWVYNNSLIKSHAFIPPKVSFLTFQLIPLGKKLIKLMADNYIPSVAVKSCFPFYCVWLPIIETDALLLNLLIAGYKG